MLAFSFFVRFHNLLMIFSADVQLSGGIFHTEFT